jgi:hypothetical protein
VEAMARKRAKKPWEEVIHYKRLSVPAIILLMFL